jgi:hypothetical protein
MKINEIIVTEGKEGTQPLVPATAGKGEVRFRDVGGYDRTYHLHRIMMATAMADGKSKKAVDMDQASWVEKYNVARPYTDEEHNMMDAAFATIDSEYQTTASDRKSREMEDTNKQSIVAPRKKNKYGV